MKIEWTSSIKKEIKKHAIKEIKSNTQLQYQKIKRDQYHLIVNQEKKVKRKTLEIREDHLRNSQILKIKKIRMLLRIKIEMANPVKLQKKKGAR